MKVAVLFARQDSHYKTMPGCDVYDIDRDARKWPGGAPIVAHPPCRAWGRLRQFAKPRSDEKDLAIYAVAWAWVHGGVVEHPAHSTLWEALALPLPGEPPDMFGGYTIELRQCDFGHRAEKLTWCYVVRRKLPPMPARREATHCIRPTHSYPRIPSVTHRERERPPRHRSLRGSSTWPRG